MGLCAREGQLWVLPAIRATTAQSEARSETQTQHRVSIALLRHNTSKGRACSVRTVGRVWRNTCVCHQLTFASMVPEPSVSNRSKASLISCGSVCVMQAASREFRREGGRRAGL